MEGGRERNGWGKGKDEGSGWVEYLEAEWRTLGPIFSWSRLLLLLLLLLLKVSVVKEEEAEEGIMTPPRPVPKRCMKEGRREK